MEVMRDGLDDEWDDDLGWVEVSEPVRRRSAGRAALEEPAGARGIAAPPPPVPVRPATAAEPWPRSGGRRRRGLLRSPVVLLALYSLGGIALVVLAANLFSGSMDGSGDPRIAPAAERSAPVVPAVATPVATASPEATVSAAELRRREGADAAARKTAIVAEAQAERAAKAAERRRIAAARRAKARARARARRRAATPPAVTVPTTPTPAAPVTPAPAPSGGGSGGGSACEFCIG